MIMKELIQIDDNFTEIFNSKIIGHEQRLTIEFTRMVDAAYYLYHYTNYKEIKETFEFYTYAWPHVLLTVYKDFTNTSGYPLFSTESQFAGELLLHYAKRMQLKKIMDLYKTQLIDICKNENDFHVEICVESFGQEDIERKDYHFCLDEEKRNINNLFKTILDKQKLTVKQMDNNVFVFMDKYIGYNTDHDIDMFFMLEGLKHSEIYYGYYDFPDEAKFGSIPYELYRRAAAGVVGIALKHITYCSRLIKKNKEIDPVNILTTWKLSKEVVEDIMLIIGVERGTAEKIFRVLQITPNELSEMYKVLHNSFPMFLEVGNGIVIRSIIGCLVEPYMFLMSRLRYLYQSDWDREIDKREKIFREQLYSLFDNDDYLVINRNINIYSDGILLTDIDAAIIDKNTKTLGVFQLKWQEPFGTNMIERNSKQRNFIKKSNEWVNTVISWFDHSDSNIISSTFGISKDIIDDIKEIKYFVIGRNFSKFSNSSIILDSRSAWGNWYQIRRILKKRNSDHLNNLFNELIIEFNEAQENKPLIDKEIFEFGGAKFHINGTIHE